MYISGFLLLVFLRLFITFKLNKYILKLTEKEVGTDYAYKNNYKCFDPDVTYRVLDFVSRLNDDR